MDDHGYLKLLPNGRVQDLRYRYSRGDRVRIIMGRLKGLSGLVDSRVFQDSADHLGERAPGYHIRLGSGQVVTVKWDQVEAVRS